MTNPMARFRQTGSLIAGLLIGLSIVVATFAVTEAASGAWPAVLFFGAPGVLVLGLALQILATAKPGRRSAPSAMPPLSAYALSTAIDTR